jgi:hypothetical protein
LYLPANSRRHESRWRPRGRLLPVQPTAFRVTNGVTRPGRRADLDSCLTKVNLARMPGGAVKCVNGALSDEVGGPVTTTDRPSPHLRLRFGTYVWRLLLNRFAGDAR